MEKVSSSYRMSGKQSHLNPEALQSMMENIAEWVPGIFLQP
jgi:hypothetical protein